VAKESRGKIRILAPPKEHGAYGVWIASILYGLLASQDPNPLLLAPGLAAALLSLLSLDYMRVNKLKGPGTLVVAVVALLYLPLLLRGLPLSLIAAGISGLLLAATLSFNKVTNITGASLLGFTGSFLLFAGNPPSVCKLLFPPLYNALATSQAQIRVTGPRREAVGLEALSGVLVVAVGLCMVLGGAPWLILVLLSADVALRYLLRIGGLYGRLGLKAYGLLEFFHTIVVQAVVALLL